MEKQAKNYISLANDHSGSMWNLTAAALKDYNTNIVAIREAATREMQDTIVSVTGFASRVTRELTVSNPHVLKPMEYWPAQGGTALYDAIADQIQMHLALPDAHQPNVSFLLMITTDGGEASSNISKEALATMIKKVMETDRWTFVLRVPKGQKTHHQITGLGIPADNIQEWETTSAGMAASTAVNTAAVDTFFVARSAGRKSSSSFYTNTAEVNLAVLKEVPAKAVKLYVVDDQFNGKWISDFILSKRQQYLKGSAFFQLTKTEPKVAQDKLILIREDTTGKFYAGAEARQMIGMPAFGNARLHPGDHKGFDIFIQSKSWNRHLVAGTGVAYWEAQGVPFTQSDVDLVTKPAEPKRATPAVAPVVQLPKVAPTNRPTKSPLTPTPRITYYASREDARKEARRLGKTIKDNGLAEGKAKRWTLA